MFAHLSRAINGARMSFLFLQNHALGMLLADLLMENITSPLRDTQMQKRNFKYQKKKL